MFRFSGQGRGHSQSIVASRLQTVVAVVACFTLSLCCSRAHAERWHVKCKASREKRLAPELDLVRHGDGCRFKGICRNGKAVFSIPEEKTNAVRSMAVKMDTNVPEVDARSRRLLISYRHENGKPTQETLQAAGLKVVEDYEHGSFLLVQPDTEITESTVQTLMNDDAVVYASPDYIVTASPVGSSEPVQFSAAAASPNDPYFNQLWGMQNCKATQAWQAIREAPRVIVAVIDTGVDYNHPDLKDSMWTRNGKHGYDFFDDDDDPMDEDVHGTHCAGTIAGVGNNGVGVVGVSWKAQIMAMRFLGPDGSGSTSDAVKCIDWAVANGAHILSNSWAGPDTPRELSEAVTRAEQKGVLFVAAAGNTVGSGNNNDTNPFYPAALPNANVISVAAIDVNDARGSFSHYGQRSVDIAAPGVGIISTVPNGQYAKLDGTSMACPHVAGAAALVWSKAFASPTQDPKQMTTVRDLIYTNARPIPALKNFWGYTAPAKVPGGVLDLSFLNSSPSNGNTPGTPKLVEFRMKVNPAKLR